jgi:hypothetical protein
VAATAPACALTPSWDEVTPSRDDVAPFRDDPGGVVVPSPRAGVEAARAAAEVGRTHEDVRAPAGLAGGQHDRHDGEPGQDGHEDERRDEHRYGRTALVTIVANAMRPRSTVLHGILQGPARALGRPGARRST